jgi:hypothetical protein
MTVASNVKSSSPVWPGVTSRRAPDHRADRPRDRERMGVRPVQMAGRLGLTLADYRALEAGELHISNDLHERMVELCGSPR